MVKVQQYPEIFGRLSRRRGLQEEVLNCRKISIVFSTFRKLVVITTLHLSSVQNNESKMYTLQTP